MKEQIEAGYVGEVLSCHADCMRDGALERPSSRTWQRDVTPRCESADHRQRARHRRPALRRGQLRARVLHGHDPGEAMVRDRHQEDGGRDFAGQHHW